MQTHNRNSSLCTQSTSRTDCKVGFYFLLYLLLMALSEIPESYLSYSFKGIWPSLKLAENLRSTAHSFVLLPKRTFRWTSFWSLYIFDNMLYCALHNIHRALYRLWRLIVFHWFVWQFLLLFVKIQDKMKVLKQRRRRAFILQSKYKYFVRIVCTDKKEN